MLYKKTLIYLNACNISNYQMPKLKTASEFQFKSQSNVAILQLNFTFNTPICFVYKARMDFMEISQPESISAAQRKIGGGRSSIGGPPRGFRIARNIIRGDLLCKDIQETQGIITIWKLILQRKMKNDQGNKTGHEIGSKNFTDNKKVKPCILHRQ